MSVIKTQIWMMTILETEIGTEIDCFQDLQRKMAFLKFLRLLVRYLVVLGTNESNFENILQSFHMIGSMIGTIT